jgi:non-ribosomal peptide synthetase component F
VPLDPAYAEARLRFMITDSGARVVLTRADVAATLPAHGAETLIVDELVKTPSPVSIAAVRAPVQPLHLANIIYTSGSTGMPKGVMVPHRGLVNLTYWYALFCWVLFLRFLCCAVAGVLMAHAGIAATTV